MVVSAPADSCGITAGNAQVLGIPTSGTLGTKFDLTQGDWLLTGTIVGFLHDLPDGGPKPDGGFDTRQILRTCTATASTNKTQALNCTADSVGAAASCTATLLQR